jgi:hypothetical protein
MLDARITIKQHKGYFSRFLSLSLLRAPCLPISLDLSVFVNNVVAYLS